MLRISCLAVFLALIFVGGCAAKESAQGPESSSLEWRLQSLEDSYLDFKESLRRENELGGKRAQQVDARLSRLEQQMEELRESFAELKESLAAMKSAAPARREATEQAEPPSSGEPSPAPSVEPPKTAVPELSETAMYDNALRLVRQEKYEEAREGLNDFLAAYPQSGLAPNALYWLGETYYGEKRYAQSILSFKEVSRRFPKHHKVSDALLKIGFAYDKLGDKENAVFYLQALRDEFPKSNAASLARKRLRELGK